VQDHNIQGSKPSDYLECSGLTHALTLDRYFACEVHLAVSYGYQNKTHNYFSNSINQFVIYEEGTAEFRAEF
jgi:hypothetical protein